MDNGHLALIEDIDDLLEEVNDFQFHDFKSTRYDAPKIELVMKLQTIIDQTKNGKYDN